MRQEEIGEEELSLATSYLEGVFPIRYETTGAIAGALANMVTFSLPEDYYDTYRSQIAGVTTHDVLQAAKSHVRPDELQVVVVGNAEILKPQLEGANVGSTDVLETPTP
jgi:zinc protease